MSSSCCSPMQSMPCRTLVLSVPCRDWSVCMYSTRVLIIGLAWGRKSCDIVMWIPVADQQQCLQAGVQHLAVAGGRLQRLTVLEVQISLRYVLVLAAIAVMHHSAPWCTSCATEQAC